MFNRASARTPSLSNTIILDIQRAPIRFKRPPETMRICLISAKGHYMSISSGLSKITARRLRMDFHSTHTYQYIHTEITSSRLQHLISPNNMINWISSIIVLEAHFTCFSVTESRSTDVTLTVYVPLSNNKQLCPSARDSRWAGNVFQCNLNNKA